LHDSLVKNIQYNSGDNTLILNLGLCNWKQNNYTELEPEMVQCELVFSGVSAFKIELSAPVDCDEILDIELLDSVGKFKIVLNSNEDVTVLTVDAKEANLIKKNKSAL